MSKKPADEKIWGWAIILALVGGFVFIKPYFGTILLALLVAFLAFPIHAFMLKKLPKRKMLAVGLTTFLTFFVVLIPLGLVLTIAVVQGTQLATSIDVNGLTESGSQVQQNVSSAINTVNDFLEPITNNTETIKVSNIQNFVATAIPNLVNAFVNSIISVVSSIPIFFVHLIMFVFVFVGVLSNYKKLLEMIHYLSPFEHTLTKKYLTKIGAMATAMTRGQLIIASLQGVASALAVTAVFGIMEYFFILAMIFTFMSFIPLGAGIITIPLGIITIMFGDVWQGSVILLNHFLIVNTIDNFRPALVPKEARLQPALTLIAAFSGVAIFGFLGVIYGPVIMIVITTTISAYVDLRKKAIL